MDRDQHLAALPGQRRADGVEAGVAGDLAPQGLAVHADHHIGLAKPVGGVADVANSRHAGAVGAGGLDQLGLGGQADRAGRLLVERLTAPAQDKTLRPARAVEGGRPGLRAGPARRRLRCAERRGGAAQPLCGCLQLRANIQFHDGT